MKLLKTLSESTIANENQKWPKTLVYNFESGAFNHSATLPAGPLLIVQAYPGGNGFRSRSGPL
ncbi:hypothetical protein GC207_13105 [bacterium]|nr:hypothetical protein [bacterium]